ncbi:MAG: type I-E CRISPR-associated protein Cse2/CasB [Caldilineaceae bacterium]
MSSDQHHFVSYLEGIRDGSDLSRARAVLATLRRGLGKEPGEDANVMRYIVPHLPAEAPPCRERPYFLIASLFALHPEQGGTGDMGNHFAAIRQSKPNEDAIERRFTALLNTHEDDLAYHLRQAVSLCKANRVPVDWHQLFRDVQGWGHPNRWVQRNWAKSFWGRTPAEQQPDPATDQ